MISIPILIHRKIFPHWSGFNRLKIFEHYTKVGLGILNFFFSLIHDQKRSATARPQAQLNWTELSSNEINELLAVLFTPVLRRTHHRDRAVGSAVNSRALK